MNCGVGPDGLLGAVEQAVRLTHAAADRAAQRRHPQGSREPPHLFLLARISGRVRQALRGPGRVGRRRLLRDHARAYPRGGFGRQAAGARAKVLPSVAETAAGVEPKTPAPLAEKSRLGARLAGRQWITTVELLPPRGYDLRSTIEKATALQRAGRQRDQHSRRSAGQRRLSSLMAAERILREAQIEPILHFCCRDRNLIGMQADLLACAACGVRNILFVTGDPPKLGDYPQATGVFDADSIGMAAVQRRLNCGIDLGGQAIDPPTFAVIGVGLDPTALRSAARARPLPPEGRGGRRVRHHAAGLRSRRPAAVSRRSRSRYGIPIIAGIWPLVSYRNASFMRNEVPGVVVPDAVMERMASVESREGQLGHGHRDRPRVGGPRPRSRGGHPGQRPFGNIDAACAVIEG